MPRFIAKLGDDAYVEWSTIVDAPVSWVKQRPEAVDVWGEDHVARADANGTSVVGGFPAGETPEQIVSGNRAGPNEECLTVAEILTRYASPAAADEFDGRYEPCECKGRGYVLDDGGHEQRCPVCGESEARS